MNKILTTKEDNLKSGIWYDKTWDIKKIKQQLLKNFGRCFWCGQVVIDTEDANITNRAIIHHLITSYMGRKKDEVTPKVLLCVQCGEDRAMLQSFNYIKKL